MKSKIENVTAYRFGWINAMKDIVNNKTFDSDMHTDDYKNGYFDAINHFNGTPCRELAYDIGLVKAYEGFYGQCGFNHLEK